MYCSCCDGATAARVREEGITVMKGFRFSLESVLRLRTQAKEQALLRWAQAARDLQQANAELEALRVHIQMWQNERRQRVSSNSTAGDLSRGNHATEELYKRWIGMTRLRQRLEHQTKQALQQWFEARKEEEIIERFKTRSSDTWTQEQEKLQQKIIDERSTLAFRRSNLRSHSQPV
jgi:flagellar export protein FliJ